MNGYCEVWDQENEFKGSMNPANSCLDENPNETSDLDGKGNCLAERVASNKPISNHCTVTTPHSIVMDEVNFKYLKHVILKFLTSRDVTY